jgi:hypothetical protein
VKEMSEARAMGDPLFITYHPLPTNLAFRAHAFSKYTSLHRRTLTSSKRFDGGGTAAGGGVAAAGGEEESVCPD